MVKKEIILDASYLRPCWVRMLSDHFPQRLILLPWTNRTSGQRLNQICIFFLNSKCKPNISKVTTGQSLAAQTKCCRSWKGTRKRGINHLIPNTSSTPLPSSVRIKKEMKHKRWSENTLPILVDTPLPLQSGAVLTHWHTRHTSRRCMGSSNEVWDDLNTWHTPKKQSTYFPFVNYS